MTQKVLKRGHTYLQWTFTVLVNCTNLVYGLETGWVSPFTSLLQSKESPTGDPLSDDQLSWVASITSMTATFGVPLFSYVADRYGRKKAVFVIIVLQMISWVIRLSYTVFPLLIVARSSAGLAAGGCFTIIPMYVKEICQNDMIGILGTLPMLMYTIGIFLMYFMGNYLDYNTVSIVALVVLLFTVLGMFKIPEAPAVLVKQGKIENALEIVALLRGLGKNDVLVKEVVDAMIEEETRFKSLPTITFLNILKNNCWRRGLVLILLLFTCYEMNGGFIVLTFATKILSTTGIEYEISPKIQSLSFPIVMITASIGLTSLVERFGRRPLLMCAFGLTALATLGMSVIIIVQNEYGNVPTWMPVIALIITVAMCTGGVSPLVFIILTELFNFQIRAKMMGLVVTYAWLMTFVSQSTYIHIASSLGEFAPFALYGIVNLIGVFFVLFFLVETRGKTEEEIYKNVKKNCNSV